MRTARPTLASPTPSPRTANALRRRRLLALAMSAGLLLGTGALVLAASPGTAATATVTAEDEGGGGGGDAPADSGGSTDGDGGTNNEAAPEQPSAPATDETSEGSGDGGAGDSAPSDAATSDDSGSDSSPNDTNDSPDADDNTNSANNANNANNADEGDPADLADDATTQDDGESEDVTDEDFSGDEATADDELTNEELVDEDLSDEGLTDEEFTGDLVDLPFTPDAQTTVTANLVVQVAQASGGPTVAAAGAGLAAETRFEVWVFSTPQLVTTGFTGPDGSFTTSAELPDGLTPGAHTVLVRGVSSDGLPTEAASGITLGEQGELLAVEPNADTSTLSAPALSDNPKAPPYTPVVALDAPEAVVTTAVAALALAAVAGAGLGAAAAGMRLPDRIDRVAAMNQETAGLDVAVRASQDTLDDVDVEHNRGWRTRFTAKGVAWGDASALHKAPGTAFVDEMSYVGIRAVGPRSPLLARALADGGPIRAMLGSLSLLLPIAAMALAIIAAIVGDGIAQPPMLALMIPLMLIGILDGLAGLLGSLTFMIAVAAMGGIVDWSSVRTLIGVALLVAGPGLIAGTFRDIRRPVGGGSMQTWERLTDLIVVPLVGAWTTLNIVEALPALGGSAFPIAQDAWILAALVLVGLIAKVALEFAAAKWFPERLATVVPKSMPQPGAAQQITSSLLRTGLFLFVSAAFVGNVWQLWVAAALFLIPNLLALLAERFPNSARLWSLSPGSVLKLAVILVLSWVISTVTLAAFGDSAEFAQMAFLLLAIPGFLLSLIALFGRAPDPGQEPWQYRPSMTWVYRVGGVLVLALTVWLALTV